MKFSVALPMLPPDHLLPLARAAEAAGYEGVAVPESVFFPEQVSADYPYSADGGRYWDATTPFVDPFVAIPAMAAVTERLKFFTNVLKLGIRDPLLVAKTVSSAAAMADGRVGLGVGLSWIPEEFAWRLVMTGEFVEYHGTHYDFDRLMVRPVPTLPVPIYVGGLSEPGLKRAARLADGWISVANTLEEIAGVVPRLAELRAEYGRSDAPFEIKALCVDAFDLDGFRRMEEIGVTDAVVCPWYFRPGDVNALDHQVDAVAWFGEEMVSKFS